MQNPHQAGGHSRATRNDDSINQQTVETMKRILLIEDEEMVSQALADLLSEEGYQVDQAANGVAAMEVFNKDLHDLLIVDLFMPEKDGIATIMDVQKQDSNAKVIAISGGGNLLKNYDYLEYAHALGALACFRKPVDANILLKTVAEHI